VGSIPTAPAFGPPKRTFGAAQPPEVRKGDFQLSMKKFKVLLINLGYCADLNGSVAHYATRFHRYFFLSRKTEQSVLEKLNHLIAREKHDLVCVVEVEKGRQISALVEGGEHGHHVVQNKYGESSFLRKIPFLRKKSNALLAKEILSCQEVYLESGSKKLLYEVELPAGIKLLLVHFALSKSVRQKQFSEIARRYAGQKNLIVCGDFNVFKGDSEIEELLESLQLRIAQSSPTFPAHKPRMNLDMFLCSKNLQISAKVMPDKLSDHLPVTLEIELA
jgi:endonuclease/exonuclease/phosphatase family metal-dependent hydrolase